MDAYDYIGSRREALDHELAHELHPRRPEPATTKQTAFLAALLAQAERASYAHNIDLRAQPTKLWAARAIDMLIAARNRGWRN